MKYNDMRGMLGIMRQLKTSPKTLINENISSNIDDTTKEQIEQLFPDGVVIDKITLAENNENITIIGSILSLDIEYNMVLNVSINESKCTVNLENMVSEGSTVFTVNQDFVNSLMEIDKLYKTFRDVHKYILDNNVLDVVEQDDQD